MQVCLLQWSAVRNTSEGSVTPDQPLGTDWTVFGQEHELAIHTAAQWLRERAACRA